ncbi:mandelate racemase/muconate lactonizing enzyme family protein [Arthrobacter sp. 2RAF6]|uniref:mandelate racemase/muconate lactonizing enzyme family protein n=1 Tax=Arthrobacter sp. 2RAF6 TaxID=3233002 RepID=UPI003F8EF36D
MLLKTDLIAEPTFSSTRPELLIRAVDAYNVQLPYENEFRPSWQPGLVRTSREFTLVKVTTEGGVVGWSGADGHQAGAIEKWVAPYLIGLPVTAAEFHAVSLRHATAKWFVDMAIWDAIGKIAGLPLHRLWGSIRDRIPAYASTNILRDPASTADLASGYREAGYKAMKIRFHRDDLREDLAVVDAIIDAEPSMTIMVDANQATHLPSPSRDVPWDYYAAKIAADELAERNVLWIEEPLPRHDLDGLSRLTAETSIYIAGGEANTGLHEFRRLIDRRAYDIIQPDCTLSEGISQMRKIAAYAEMAGLHFVPHHGLSGLGLAATMNLACTVPSPVWLEVMDEPGVRPISEYQCLSGIITTPIEIDSDGYVRPSERPGLGIEIDEDAIAGFRV